MTALHDYNAEDRENKMREWERNGRMSERRKQLAIFPVLLWQLEWLSIQHWKKFTTSTHTSIEDWNKREREREIKNIFYHSLKNQTFGSLKICAVKLMLFHFLEIVINSRRDLKVIEPKVWRELSLPLSLFSFPSKRRLLSVS